MILVLGAGLAGLSASFHLGHENCLLLEQNLKPFGHIGNTEREGFLWDKGPHVSFTTSDYVRGLFACSVENEFQEHEVLTGNYFQGHWIDHPAQTSLHQVPEPLRSECLKSFLNQHALSHGLNEPRNYQEWLNQAFGPVFAKNFPARYTYKYWTRKPCDLTTDWVANRVFRPNIREVTQGSKSPLPYKTHYIQTIRYPTRGGFQSFATSLANGASIEFGAQVVRVDLKNREVNISNGRKFCYDRLVNTLPLPVFLACCENKPREIVDAMSRLSCTQLLLVNVAAKHDTKRSEHWLYVYDEEKLSTRISFTEKFSGNNAREGWTGVQVEVYFSRHKPLLLSIAEVEKKVVAELVEMGLIEQSAISKGEFHVHSEYCSWANVIFDHECKPALSVIWEWLEQYGLFREEDDLSPLTDWGRETLRITGSVTMAGRFSQWKYFWTDDCVLRGGQLIKGNCTSQNLP